jgi:predicted AAA+ superfamily ATPase
MRSIFDSCTPRSDVASGELRDDMFAARLGDVIAGRADPIYQDPARFFPNTCQTDGLRTLLRTVLARLAGRPEGDPVIRLETTFGGGKTHNLIALYHLASDRVSPDLTSRFVEPSLLPDPGSIAVVGVVGDQLELGGLDHGDVATYTSWGEVAYQLGGAEGYSKVEQSDREGGPAPGCQFIQQIVGDRPLVIMIDEIARHLRAARAKRVGDSTLAEQTVAFFMSLLEFASSRERTAVVFTLAGPQDAFARETELMTKELAEARSVSARREQVLTPAQETERPAIVTHRLFERVDKTAAEEVARAYLEYYAKAEGQGADLPERALRGPYAEDIKLHYPFHPELLLTLNRKTSTIPNFQSTRGALRLLALTVRKLWGTRPRPADTYLIHPHHLDLADESVVNDLTSRLDRPAFRQVVEADIATPTAGSVAHATEVDRQFSDAGRPPYSTRAATTVFLHSLTQGIASGVDPAELNLAVLQPDDDPALMKRAVDQLVDKCWFLEWDGRHYRFKTEPSLNKIVEDEKASIGRTKAREELDQRIRAVWKKGFLQPAYFPSEAAEVDDDAQEPKVCVIHYDAAAIKSPEEGPPELVRKIAEYSGTQSDFRKYPNNVLFLVADAGQVDNILEQARRYLAIGRIVGDHDRMAEFNEEQRKKLRAMYDAADLEVRVAITRAYRFLFYPGADAPAKHSYLHCEVLPAQDQGEVKQDQTQVLLRVLKNLDKVLTADDPPLAPAYMKARAWPAGAERVTTDEMRRAFARQRGLKLLLDLNQLKTTVKRGVESGVWVYYDAQEQTGYGRESPPPLVQIGEDFELLTLEEAERTNIPIKGRVAPEICPICRQVPCVCGEEIEKGREEEGLRVTGLRAEGAPGQAFQAILDQAHDRGVQRLRRLVISCEGMGREGMNDVVAMGLAIPQFGKGQFRVDLSLTTEFGAEEQMSVSFKGGWERYRRLKQVSDAFGQEASRVSARMTLTADFPDGLPLDDVQYQTIRDVLTSLNMGRLTVRAQPADEEGTK